MQPYVAIAHRIGGGYAEKLPHFVRRRFVITLHTLRNDFRGRRHLVRLAPAVERKGSAVIAEQVGVQGLQQGESFETGSRGIGPCGGPKGNCADQQTGGAAGQNVSDLSSSQGHHALPAFAGRALCGHTTRSRNTRKGADVPARPAQPRQGDSRITLQKFVRRKFGSLSASTSALTFPNVVCGLPLIPS